MGKGVFTEKEAYAMGNPTSYQKEYDSMKLQLSEYDDFWEWFEDEYGESKRDVFAKYDEFCEKQATKEPLR